MGLGARVGVGAGVGLSARVGFGAEVRSEPHLRDVTRESGLWMMWAVNELS